MKLHPLIILVSTCCLALPLRGADSTAGASGPQEAASTTFLPAQAGPHEVVWDQIREETGPSGETILRTNKYTELGTGLNRWTGTSWERATPQIRITAEGAVADQTQHKVTFNGNLNSRGAVVITTPEGEVLDTSILAVGYFDQASEKSAVIAEVKNSNGSLLSTGDTVLYPDAFKGIKADVMYVNMVDGFEQFVVFHEQLPSPEDWGLNPETTVIEVFTEFSGSDRPEVRQVTSKRGMREVIKFGSMSATRGEAFLLDSRKGRVSVDASWLEDLDGRKFLVEHTRFAPAAKAMKTLPLRSASSGGPSGKILRTASRGRVFPAARETADNRPLELAANPSPERGWAWDYTLLNSQPSVLLRGDMTYYVSSAVNVSSDLTIEGGTVVKFAVSSTAGITASDVTWKTADYRPAVFTAKDDNAHGQDISGSTGNPDGKWYGYIGLNLFNAEDPEIHHARFLYLSNAISAVDITITHAQFAGCLNGLADNAAGLSHPTLRNVLIYKVGNFAASSSFCGDTMRGEHITAHYCTNFLEDTTGVLALTNSLFAGSGGWQCSTLVTNQCAFLASDAGLFQRVGGGGHYLAEDSPYRSVGTESINEDLQEDLKKRTTYPPLIYSNLTFTVDTVLAPQAQRDVGLPDIGFHYEPLDYLFGGVHAYCNITVGPGTALGWFRTSSGWQHAGHGIHIGDNQRVEFKGLADAPCYWGHCNTVQEQDFTAGYGPGGMTGWAWPSIQNASEIVARFTMFSALPATGHYRDDYGWLIARLSHCEIYAGNTATYNGQHYYTNCFYFRSVCGMTTAWPDSRFTMRNCTMIGGLLAPYRYSGGANVPVVIRENAFDGTTIQQTSGTTTDYDYNFTLTGASQVLPSGAGDEQVASFGWEHGPLGDYYLPSDSSLVNASSLQAADVGLYHFTTQVNQDKDSSNLDIGYHYLALDGSDEPKDYDGDGIPDYLEDLNGDNSVGDDESDWQSGTGLLRVLILRPQNGAYLH